MKTKIGKGKGGRVKNAKRQGHKSRHLKALPAPDRSYDPTLLEKSRIAWQHGDWADLARLGLESLTHHPDRARLALIVAAAHAQLGDMQQARLFTRQALDWGCTATVVAQVLIASAHNALGRVATCLEDASAANHFTAALRLVEPHADLPLLSRSRQIREVTRLGLLTAAADLLAIDLGQVAQAPADHADRLAMLDRRLTELQQALAENRDPRLATGAGDEAVSGPQIG